MIRSIRACSVIGFAAALVIATPALAAIGKTGDDREAAVRTPGTFATRPQIALWRLDCGSLDIDISNASDTFDYVGQRRKLVDSCYLIKHGDQFMLWDTGLAMHLSKAWTDGGARPPERSIVDQLAEIGVTPSQIGIIGLSHWHPDHMGQTAAFPGAKLMIGKEDWDVFKASSAQLDPDTARPWLSGGAPLDLVEGDRDVFGDGDVVMLKTPGHTPGHHALLVRLREKGAVLLTGDVVTMRQSYDRNLVQAGDFDRAAGLASLARLKAIARNLKATVVIQHEADDVGKLPTFPDYAK